MVLSFAKAFTAAVEEMKAAQEAQVGKISQPGKVTKSVIPNRNRGRVKYVPGKPVAASPQGARPTGAPAPQAAASNGRAAYVSRFRRSSEPTVRPSGFRLRFNGVPSLSWKPHSAKRLRPLDYSRELGSRLSPPEAKPKITRELVIGLDFGTSCAKVVVTDKTMGQSYAVPLTKATGIDSYLLPARITESQGIYLLDGEGIDHTDLKLALLAAPENPALCARVCAYLAMTIQAARAWMFTEHRQSLLQAEIMWTLAVGQPADHAQSSASKQLFHDLARVAWELAGKARPIGVQDAITRWKQRESLTAGDEVEILVMPELSAQIHGFVNSQSYDSRAANIFLLVDVGAGTVDASLFHVKKQSNGNTSFSFFTNSVQPTGLANLHRHRIGWWQEALRGHEQGLPLITELEGIRLPTDYRGRYPESFRGYLQGVSATFFGTERNPDEAFFLTVRNQVAGSVLHRAWQTGLLTQGAIQDTPMFLCGGGSRHPLFKELISELQQTRNASWLRTRHQQLTQPTHLLAPGVVRSDFDRLSVAYGLSHLSLGAIKQVERLVPVVDASSPIDWAKNYVGKDVC